MYNQYIPAPREEVNEIHNDRREEAAEAMAFQQPPSRPQHHPSALGSLSQTLGSRLGSIRFDAETLIALVVVWFLISDGEEIDTELLLLIGILLVLGI